MLAFGRFLLLLVTLFGFCYSQAQDSPSPDLEKALRYYNRSLRLDPQHGPTYRERGQVYLSMGNTTFAREDFNTALRLKDSSHQTLYLRACLLEQLDREDEAHRDYSLALKRNPYHPPTLNAVAYYQMKAGSYEQALALLNRALSQDSSLLIAHLNRGSAYYQLGQATQAALDFRYVLSQVPEHPVALSNLGLALCAQGQVQEGMMHLDRALELDQSLAEAWYNRGLARFTQGLTRDGEADFQQAKALKPQLEIRVRGEIWEPEK